MTLLEDLVALHGEHGVDGLQEARGFHALCERYRGDRGFHSTLAYVADVARPLEYAVAEQMPRDQVAFALKVLNTFRRQPPKQQICIDLTIQRCAPRWSAAQKDYYQRASHKLANWRDYFLSFTNNNPTHGHVIAINNEHKRLISEGFGQRFGPPRTTQENLLAHLLNYLLRNRLLDGYFYPDERGAADVEATLRDEAATAFAFVQLVQCAIFDRWPNYCMMEFDAAVQDESRAVVFVFAEKREGFVSRELIDIRMHDWYDSVMVPDAVEIVQTSSAAEARAVIEMLRRRVVGRVESARQELFRNVPA